MVIDQPKRSGSTAQGAKAKANAKSDTESRIYIDGKFLAEADAKISVFDHGLLYGDGIFEGIRFYNGRVFRLEDPDRLFSPVFVDVKVFFRETSHRSAVVVQNSDVENCQVNVNRQRELKKQQNAEKVFQKHPFLILSNPL